MGKHISMPRLVRPDGTRAAPRLQRVAFTTSRLAEFCGEKELTAQTDHAPDDWPLIIAKELTDNALDACEEAEIAPEIAIEVSTERGEIVSQCSGRIQPAQCSKRRRAVLYKWPATSRPLTRT